MTAAELRERAAQIRAQAQYADDGRVYREEMALAQQLENQARWLEQETE